MSRARSFRCTIYYCERATRRKQKVAETEGVEASQTAKTTSEEIEQVPMPKMRRARDPAPVDEEGIRPYTTTHVSLSIRPVRSLSRPSSGEVRGRGKGPVLSGECYSPPQSRISQFSFFVVHLLLVCSDAASHILSIPYFFFPRLFHRLPFLPLSSNLFAL